MFFIAVIVSKRSVAAVLNVFYLVILLKLSCTTIKNLMCAVLLDCTIISLIIHHFCIAAGFQYTMMERLVNRPPRPLLLVPNTKVISIGEASNQTPTHPDLFNAKK